MKKVIAVLMVVVVLCSLAGCSQKPNFRYVNDEIIKDDYIYLNEETFLKKSDVVTEESQFTLKYYRSKKEFKDFPYYVPSEKMFNDEEQKENVKFILGEEITPEQNRYVLQYENEKGFYWIQYPNNFKSFYFEFKDVPQAPKLSNEKMLETVVEYNSNLNVELNNEYIYTVEEIVDSKNVTSEKIDFRRQIDGYSFFRGNEYIPWYYILSGDKIKAGYFFDTPYVDTGKTIKKPSKTYNDVIEKIREDIPAFLKDGYIFPATDVFIEPCYTYIEEKDETLPAYAVYFSDFKRLVKLYDANNLSEINTQSVD